MPDNRRPARLGWAVIVVWPALWGPAWAVAPHRSDAAEVRSLPVPNGDWPTFLGPTGDGKSTERGLVLNWPAQGPRVVWHKRLGASYGIGSVSRGRLYQFDRFADNARLTCLNALTGDELWRFESPTDYSDMYGYHGGPRCSPLVDGERVYLFGADGMLFCLNTSDGKLLWQVNTREAFGVVQNFFGVASNPVVEGRLLIVMVGGSPAACQNVPPGQLDEVVGDGSGIVAFDKRTGEVVYAISDELASCASLKLATIGDRRWCFAFARGGLLGFEPATGQVDFHYPWRAKLLESVHASVPVVAGDEVLISEAYGPGSSLLKVRPGGYEVVWRDKPRSREKAMQTHWNTPIYHDGSLYGCSGRHTHNADLRCVDWRTGKVMWTADRTTRTSLLYVDGHFISLGEFGQLIVFKANPARFELVAAVEEGTLRSEVGEPLLAYPCWAAPILSHGLLYVRGNDRLVCLDLRPKSRP
ncbi:MAG: PQQ-binding-like beta-propeller repeat protein [Candidatus Anammoximicrobium sp.]|nr:PQQ-binding-like beta-propeller repeat protein [Candidatus Anammoximicrobium sp.]